MKRDKSGHRKTLDERGGTHSGDPHREGQVKTRKETDRARGTHKLETASGGRSQDTERNRPSKGHSRPGDRIGSDKSRYGKKPTGQGVLTNLRPRREGQVSTERNRPTEGNSPPGDRIGRDKSGYGRKESTARGTHLLENASGGTSQDTGRNRPSALTSPSWRPHREGQVRIRK